MIPIPLLHTLTAAVAVLATPIIYDGRAPLNYTESDLDGSLDPYLTVVKGTENASHYTTLLGPSVPPTPLWNCPVFSEHPGQIGPIEQVLAVSIDNSSVFAPGGVPQFGFRRTDIIAEKNLSPANLLPEMETGVTVFHFSVKPDDNRPLNYTHEYQVVFIEPSDGSHVFELQIGSPFTNPTGKLPAADAYDLKVRDHALNVLFHVPFTSGSWHNFAVQVDWGNRTLAVLYSKDADPLKAVTQVVPNLSVAAGTAGQGEFHFGILKLPLVNPADSPQDQNDVVHYGIQEGTTEGLLYSGFFVEGIQNGISIGGGKTLNPLGT